MRKLNICFLAEGISSHLKKWADFFVKEGHTVYLISNTETDIENVELIKIDVDFENNRYLSFLKEAFRVRGIISKIKPDILHCHYAILYGWMGCFSGFHPYIVTLYGGDILSDQGAKSNIIKRKMLKKTVNSSDLITYHSFFLRDAVSREDEKLLNKSEFVSFGIDLDFFNPANWSFQDKRTDNSDSLTLYCPRPFRKVYNNVTIVKAIPYIKEKFPEVKFILRPSIVDTDINKEDAKEIYRLIEKLKIEENVTLYGKVSLDKLKSFYTSSLITLSAALSDGMPICLLEAMACGSVPVFSNLPHYSELLKDGENALLFDPYDEKELAKKVINILSNEGLQRDIIANNLEKVKIHDFQTNMKKMENIYYKLAGLI